jgi:hypothetical protein
MINASIAARRRKSTLVPFISEHRSKHHHKHDQKRGRKSSSSRREPSGDEHEDPLADGAGQSSGVQRQEGRESDEEGEGFKTYSQEEMKKMFPERVELLRKGESYNPDDEEGISEEVDVGVDVSKQEFVWDGGYKQSSKSKIRADFAQYSSRIKEGGTGSLTLATGTDHTAVFTYSARHTSPLVHYYQPTHQRSPSPPILSPTPHLYLQKQSQMPMVLPTKAPQSFVMDQNKPPRRSPSNTQKTTAQSLDRSRRRIPSKPSKRPLPPGHG